MTLREGPERESYAEMSAADVVDLIRLMEQNGIEVYIDGGWGVDALLGAQIRAHSDVDIALPHKYVPKLRELLAARGYAELQRVDTRECNFVLVDGRGRQVDVHSYTFDEDGKNVWGIAYMPEHLTGSGSINGYSVKCISPEWMVKFHSGYELDQNDYRDVLALCRRFDISLPREYEKFARQD